MVAEVPPVPAPHTIQAGCACGSCPACKGKGYKGRRAVAEALYFSPAIREAVVGAGEEINEDKLRQIAESEGMLTLQASARVLVKMGEVSLEEMLRVTAGEH